MATNRRKDIIEEQISHADRIREENEKKNVLNQILRGIKDSDDHTALQILNNTIDTVFANGRSSLAQEIKETKDEDTEDDVNKEMDNIKIGSPMTQANKPNITQLLIKKLSAAYRQSDNRDVKLKIMDHIDLIKNLSMSKSPEDKAAFMSALRDPKMKYVYNLIQNIKKDPDTVGMQDIIHAYSSSMPSTTPQNKTPEKSTQISDTLKSYSNHQPKKFNINDIGLENHPKFKAMVDKYLDIARQTPNQNMSYDQAIMYVMKNHKGMCDSIIKEQAEELEYANPQFAEQFDTGIVSNNYAGQQTNNY